MSVPHLNLAEDGVQDHDVAGSFVDEEVSSDHMQREARKSIGESLSGDDGKAGEDG